MINYIARFYICIWNRDEGGDSNVVQKQFDVEDASGDLPEEREQSPTAFLADSAPDDGTDSIRLTVSLNSQFNIISHKPVLILLFIVLIFVFII